MNENVYDHTEQSYRYLATMQAELTKRNGSLFKKKPLGT